MIACKAGKFAVKIIVLILLAATQSVDAATWMANYSNDVLAYIPSNRVLKEGVYESGEAIVCFGQPSPWAEGIEENIISEVQRQVKQTASVSEEDIAKPEDVKPKALKALRENPQAGFAPLPIKFAETVGLVVHFNQGETLDHLTNLKELGVKWVRDEESWSGVEKEKGQYAWSKKRKQRLAFYRENNISVIFALTYGASRTAYPDDPYNPEGFGGYAVAAARLHKEAGVNVVLEIFNEPHNFGLLKKYGGKWYGAKECAWIDHYVKMANEAVKTVLSLGEGTKRCERKKILPVELIERESVSWRT